LLACWRAGVLAVDVLALVEGGRPARDPAAFGGDPADAFDVIVPSVPGFGFPGPLAGFPDVNFWKVADLWHVLMTQTLGYEKYAAGGCDIGGLVSSQLGHKYAGELYGIYIASGLPPRQRQRPRPRRPLHPLGESRRLDRRPAPHLPRPQALTDPPCQRPRPGCWPLASRSGQPNWRSSS
jgi:pimeloyl-ACP methyl ester carboxylesterase